MSYWNTPPAGGYKKKPLTKQQLKAIQEAYQKGDVIIEEVKKREAQENPDIQKQIENDLDSAFL